MEITKLPIAVIKPYENNPRRNEGAVDAVKASIEQCGYIAPIILDEDYVILAGHTRYAALKELHYTDVEVIVKEGLSEEQKKKYRILDKEAGAYGVIFEGMKFLKKKEGTVKVAGDYCYPIEVLRRDFTLLKAECHKNGLKFWSGENRLRDMGDDLTCCGTEGVEGFKVNKFNLSHLVNGDKVEASESQMAKGTADCFSALHQDAIFSRQIKNVSFKDAMIDHYVSNKKATLEMFGKK